jgi:hypothetical protein
MNVAVVGAGPVGIYFTKLCLDKGYKVTLIDSGNFSGESNLLTKKNYLFRTPSSIPDGVHRIGGGSTQWAGRMSEFLVEDFHDWPMKKSDLETHYQTLYKFLNVGELDDQEVIDEFFAYESNNLPSELKLRSFRFCKPNFFMNLFEEIKNHINLEVLTGHFCIKAIQDSEHKLRIELLTKNFDITSRYFDKIVIACGTLQTTALIQRSVELIQPRSENFLGNYLMEHLEGYVGTLKIKRKHVNKIFSRLTLDENNRAINKFEGIGIAFTLATSTLPQNQLNVQFEIRKFMPKPYLLAKIIGKHNFKSVYSAKLFSFMLFLEKGFRFIFRKIRVHCEFFIGRELFSIYVKSEELAYENSKVFLDDVSKNILTYDHKVSEETFALLLLHLRNFEEIFNSKFKVKLKYFKELKELDGVRTFFGANWHPMGTVRMGVDPELSICNSDLEVHGVKNLFVVSAAVFPSGSNTNPTFTTLALADRLAKSSYFN